MKNFNIICLLMACALIFVAISCVNAADINDSSINAHEDIIMPVQDNGNTPINNQTSISENIDVKNNTSTTITVTNDYKNHENKISNENVAKDNHIISSSGSMTELKNQLKFIRSGSTYTFNKDYSFVKGQDIIHAIVIMGNNLVIDGNGHTIDGKYLMDHFYISGNNVTIKNLTIIHFKNRFNSPIAWTGNNGVLSNCRISENYGVNGGAMEWSGKNGVISNSNFINNTAQKIAGAIFNQGHLEINNCGFHNNYAYGEGDNICNGKDGVVIVNGKDCSNGTGIVHYAKSYSATQSKWIAIGGTILSIGAGIAAGIITANPVAGFAVGFAVGAGIGAVSAGIIIEHKFDVNYDRATLAANLIISDALSGGFAGYCAGSMKLSMTSATYDGIHPAAPGFGNIISGIVKMCECSINES